MSKYSIIVPAGYNPTGEYRDQLLRLASYLLELTSQTKQRMTLGYFIDIHSSVWEELFGAADAYRVKRLAIQSGLLEENSSYLPGLYSKSYRLTNQHRSGKFEPVLLDRKPRARKASLSFKNLDETGWKLADRLRSFKVPSDIMPRIPWEEYQLYKLRAGDFYACRCQYRRFHSNYTSLSKRIRHSLKIDTNSPLASIDVVSMQPMLIGVLSERESSPTKIVSGIKHESKTNQPHQSQTPSNQDTTTRITNKQHAHSTSKTICPLLFHEQRETEQGPSFLDLCISGEIYEFVLQKLLVGNFQPYRVRLVNGREWQVNPSKWKRKHVKKSFLVCIFDQIQSMKRNPVWHVIEKYFPEIASYILKVKSDEDYQALARRCQQFESSIMIDGIAAKFMESFPDSPILTVHDEVIVSAEMIEELENIFYERFAMYGIRPSLKAKRLGMTA